MCWPFREWGGDAVLFGHDHVYERIDDHGLPYFVNGPGEAAIYSFGQPVAVSRVRFNAARGAMLGEAGPGGLTFRFVTTSGAEVDRHHLPDECPQGRPPAIAMCRPTPVPRGRGPRSG